MRYPRFFPAALLLTASLAAGTGCDDDNPTGPNPTAIQVAGSWSAADGGSDAFGAIVFHADSVGAERDLVADGATIELVLAQNGTTSGRLFIPAGVAGVPDFDENLAGTWALVDGRVVLSHAADTFLRDMPLTLEGDRLVGDQRFGGVRVRVVLQRG